MKENLTGLDWLQIVEKLQSLATSATAKEHLNSISVCESPLKAKESFGQIQEGVEVLKTGARPHFESVDLVSNWLPRLEKKGVLKTLELRDVRFFCIEALAIREVLKDFKSEYLSFVYSQIFDADEPLAAIDQLMTPNGEIRTDASETLYGLTREKTDLTKKVQNTLDKISRDNNMADVLQERFVTTREGRWVLPVRSGAQHDFKGIIHASSQTKQTVYMEPQDVIPINNRMREIEVEIDEEIERLLSQLSEYLSTLAYKFKTAKELFINVDQVLAKAHLAHRLNAEVCEFSNEEISLNGLRHPLLVLQGSDVVPNSIELNPEKRILLLSGPNAGGKTILLKSIGLASQMARCGLLICASPGSRLPFFKDFHVGVGDAQSVDSNLSTFAAHLKTLNGALQAKGPQSLILIDEICGSTDPEEGSALAKSFLLHYAEHKTFAIVTSHLAALKSGWPPDSGVLFGSMEFDPKQGPTYQLLLGIAGQSLAIQTAKRVGVIESVIKGALEYLSPEYRRYESGLSEIEDMKTSIRSIKDQMVKDQKAAQKSKAKYDEDLEKLQKERDQILAKALKRAEKKIDEMVDVAKAQDTFKRFEDVQKIKMELPEIVKAPKAGETRTQISSADDFEKAFPPGSKIFITTIGRDGVVQGVPNAKGEVSILSESMRLMIPWQLLKVPDHLMNPTKEVLRRAKGISSSSLVEDRVIDLRGHNVEAAIEKLDTEFDTATLNQEDRIKIIHGVGTEVLRKGIRSYLSRSLYVKKWYAGSPETGGDGITWVELQ